jgi:hypothetical protein
VFKEIISAKIHDSMDTDEDPSEKNNELDKAISAGIN